MASFGSSLAAARVAYPSWSPWSAPRRSRNAVGRHCQLGSHSASSVRGGRGCHVLPIAAGIGVVVAGMVTPRRRWSRRPSAFRVGHERDWSGCCRFDLRRQGQCRDGRSRQSVPRHHRTHDHSSNMMGLVKQVGGAVADVGNGWAKSLDLASSTSSTSWRSLSPIKSRVWVTSLTESSRHR